MSYAKVTATVRLSLRKADCPACHALVPFHLHAQTRSQWENDYVECSQCHVTFDCQETHPTDRDAFDSLAQKLHLAVTNGELEEENIPKEAINSEVQFLRAEVARLTADLAARKSEYAVLHESHTRQHGELAETLARNTCLTAELAAATAEKVEAQRMEQKFKDVLILSNGATKQYREERDRLSAALASIIAIRDEALATSEDPDADIRFGYDGDKIGYLRWGYKFELRDAFMALSDPAAILAAVKARAKAEGLGVAAEHLLQAANDWEYGDERGVDADVIIRRLAAEISRMADRELAAHAKEAGNCPDGSGVTVADAAALDASIHVDCGTFKEHPEREGRRRLIPEFEVDQKVRGAKAEGLREAADQLTPIIPSPIGPLHAAGMMFCVEHLRKMAEELDRKWALKGVVIHAAD